MKTGGPGDWGHDEHPGLRLGARARVPAPAAGAGGPISVKHAHGPIGAHQWAHQ